MMLLTCLQIGVVLDLWRIFEAARSIWKYLRGEVLWECSGHGHHSKNGLPELNRCKVITQQSTTLHLKFHRGSNCAFTFKILAIMSHTNMFKHHGSDDQLWKWVMSLQNGALDFGQNLPCMWLHCCFLFFTHDMVHALCVFMIIILVCSCATPFFVVQILSCSNFFHNKQTFLLTPIHYQSGIPLPRHHTSWCHTPWCIYPPFLLIGVIILVHPFASNHQL
jgi:hypothetical protein